MINQHSIDQVNQSKFTDAFVKPLYESYCFSNIPGTIKRLLTEQKVRDCLPDDVLASLSGKYDNVILFLVDAFGWKFFERYQDKYPFLLRFREAGAVSKLTTQFPSTTAAHLTCIHSGLPVYESGIYEWNYYEPKVGAIISPLMFSFAGDKSRDVLYLNRAEPSEIYPDRTIYTDLKEFGVDSHIFQSVKYTPSTYSDYLLTGAATYPFTNLREACSKMTEAMLKTEGKNYYFFYYDAIDTAGHDSGPDSPQFDHEVKVFFETIEKYFFSQIKGNMKNTLLLVTADHGQEAINPYTTCYIDKEIPQFADYILSDPGTGKLLVPAGSSRDFFLHIKPEFLAEAEKLLQDKLGDRAALFRTEELIRAGVFGSQVSGRLIERLGNLVVLPYEGQSVWWSENKKYENDFYGHHGGMLPSEMETMLLALAL